MHVSTMHADLMPFRCDLCGKGYHSAQGLLHHKVVHEGKTFTCPVCDRSLTQKGHLKKHMQRVHKSIQCISCMMVVPLEEYDDHVRIHIANQD